MKISDLKNSGHAPSLFSAFLHFDISFMVWVIFGALMPFISTDVSLTGLNLKVTPTAAITRPGQFTLVIKGPQSVKDNPKLKSSQPRNVANLIIKPGDPSVATSNAVKPLEKFVVNTTDPATIALVNATSKYIRIEAAPGATRSPYENVIALKPASMLGATGFQGVATGYPAALKLGLVGLPLLAAGFWRILLGVLADRFGSKRVGVASMLCTLIPLYVGYAYGTTYDSLVFMGLFLGLAGASFAVSLPLASRWYPPHLQGIAMGIAGAGNSGTVVATIFAPILARTYGWHGVFALLMIPVTLALVTFALMAKDAPNAPKPASARDYAAVFGQSDAYTFCLLYFVTFGGFVGLSTFMNTFFVDQFDAPKAAVGMWTWPFIIAGSLLRPVGGALSDKIGGIRMLTILYSLAVVAAIGVGLSITNQPVVCTLLFVLMGALGMGNGSVFQMVPQRFRKQIGVMTGLVGAAGGVGGYYLNFALGHLHDISGSYATGFYAFAAIAVVAAITLIVVAPSWQRSWLGKGGVAQDSAHIPEGRVLIGAGEAI